jgi:hypothetical protein
MKPAVNNRQLALEEIDVFFILIFIVENICSWMCEESNLK